MNQLTEYFRFNPRILNNTVFKYLTHDSRVNGIPTDGQKAMIACTARSGSSYLSVALRRYGFSFNEYLNTEGYVKRFADEFDPSLEKFAGHLAREAEQGVLGLKIPYASLAYLIAMREIPDRIDEWSIVYLIRRNVIQQAISRRIASITQKWTANMAGERAIASADYDFAAILKHAEGIINENSNWERFFLRLGLNPMRVVYEDIIVNEQESLAEIGSHLSRKWQPSINREVELKKQGTALNDRWEERFKSDLRRSLNDLPKELETAMRQE